MFEEQLDGIKSALRKEMSGSGIRVINVVYQDPPSAPFGGVSAGFEYVDDKGNLYRRGTKSRRDLSSRDTAAMSSYVRSTAEYLLAWKNYNTASSFRTGPDYARASVSRTLTAQPGAAIPKGRFSPART